MKRIFWVTWLTWLIIALSTIDAHAGVIDDELRRADMAACPQGTVREAVPGQVARYIAQNMQYDYNMYRGTQYYEFCFALLEGRGVCVGYSTLFCEMLRSIPIDETGRVNYGAKNPVYIQCAGICNGVHMWNAVFTKDGWLWYDVTFYDNENGDERYIPMTYDTVNDGCHGGAWMCY